MRLPRTRGFTLLEVMVVVVIMGIMAALVVMNVDGIDQRKALQARDQLAQHLRQIGRDALDQGRVLGLRISPGTQGATMTYQVVELQPVSLTSPQTIQSDQARPNPAAQALRQWRWQLAADYTAQSLPEGIILTIELEQTDQLDRLTQESHHQLTTLADAPQIIWRGDGEATPAILQLNWQQRPLGQPLQLDSNSQIDVEPEHGGATR